MPEQYSREVSKAFVAQHNQKIFFFRSEMWIFFFTFAQNFNAIYFRLQIIIFNFPFRTILKKKFLKCFTNWLLMLVETDVRISWYLNSIILFLLIPTTVECPCTVNFIVFFVFHKMWRFEWGARNFVKMKFGATTYIFKSCRSWMWIKELDWSGKRKGGKMAESG